MANEGCCSEKCMKCLHLAGFDHPYQLDFIRAKWNRNADFNINVAMYGLVRLLVGIYLTFWMLWTNVNNGPKSLIYFTTWGFILLCADALLQGILIFWYWKDTFKEDILKSNTDWKRNTISIPWLMKLSWIMTSLSSSMALTITFGYWVIIYRNLKDTAPLLADLHVHLINSVYTVVSIFVAARPFRWQHIYIPALELITYLIFAFVYHLAGGTNNLGSPNIYSFMDFSKLPMLFGHCFAILGASLMLHLFLCAINCLAEKLFRKLCGKNRMMDSELTVIPVDESAEKKTDDVEMKNAEGDFEAQEEQ